MEKIIDDYGNITNYASKYEERNKEKDYDENFAEAIRIYTVNKNYFEKHNYQKIPEFINKYFSQIN